MKSVSENALGNFCARAIEAVVGQRKVLVELRAVASDTGADLVEDFDGETAGIVGSFQHERWNGTDKYRLGNAALWLPVPSNVTRDFAATGGMANMDRVL